MKAKLDTKSVAAVTLDEGQKETFIWDTELSGFGLRLQGQRRAYVAQYRASGRTRRVTLGMTAHLTPMQARDGARKILARVALAGDPQDEKAAKQVKAELTFRKLLSLP
jgi:hypothetical protein